MIDISTNQHSGIRFTIIKSFMIIVLLLMIIPGFSQLFVQSTTQTNGAGIGTGIPMPGTPGPNVIFSSAGKVNTGFDQGSLTPCTFGYSGFTSIPAITTYSTSGPAIEITLAPSGGYVMTATGISAKMRRSTTGPQNATFAYSTNGGTTWINNTNITLLDLNCQSGTDFTWTFACPLVITDLQTFKFRIYIFNSTGTTGATQIENLTVNGSSVLCSSITAAISGTTTICAGSNTNITFTGSPLSTVTYTINGGPNQMIALNCTGSATLNTGALASTTTYNLVSVGLGSCSKTISGSAVISITPQISSAVISGTNSICSAGSTNLSIVITGGISPYTVTYTDGTSNFTINNYISGTPIPVSPTVNTTYTIVSVTGSGICSASLSNTGSAVITMKPASTAAVISGTAGICTGSSTNLSVTITGGVSPYTVVYFNGSSNTTLNNYISGTAIPVSPGANTTYSLVSVASSNGCNGMGNSGSAIITLTSPGTWKGINTNWNDPLNWCDGVIPGSTTNVIIPVTSNYPLITTADPQVKNITIAAGGAKIDISASGTFSIAGTIAGSGTINNNGTIVMNGTSGLQNFPVSGLALGAMNNLVINNVSGVNMGVSLGVSGVLTLTNGIFTVGAFTLSIGNPIGGTVTNLSANNTSTITIGGTVAGVNLPASITQLKSLNVTNTSGTILQGNLNISTLLQIAGAAGTVDAGTYTLDGLGGLKMTTGNLLLSKNAAVLPELSGTYTLTGGAVTFNGSGVGINAQTIRPVNYFNLSSLSTGDRVLSNSGTIGIGNIFTPSINSYTITGSTINFNKAGSQNIPAFTYNNLTVSGGAFTKTLTGAISIKGSLGIAANTVLALVDNDITLKSDASNTASVDKILSNNSITYGLGRFIVERFIPTGTSHTKTWQFLSVPTTAGQSIKDSWQEGATGGPADNPKPGYGTQLTSDLSNALALGFDFYTAAGPSVKVYNSALLQWDGVTSTSIPVANTKGYMIFVRGDRSVTASNQAAVTTIMRTRGKLFSPGTDAPASIPVAGGKFESVGNPYASAIDLKILNGLVSGDIQNVYYVWDPQLTTAGPSSAYGLGGYRTLTYNGVDYDVTPPGGSYGSTVKNIQSGQAFFVRSFSIGGTVNFAESCKASGSSLVNRPANDPTAKIRTNLRVIYNQVPVLIDGVLLKISSDFSNDLNKEDALKVTQSGENINLFKSGEALSVESRNLLQQSDTIEYRLEKLKQHIYEFEFIPQDLNDPSVTAYLVDKFLQTQTAISLTDTTRIRFEPAINDPLSIAADRFFIVFKKDNIVLPFAFTDITAKRNQDNTSTIAWETKNENGDLKYEIERSSDGINFYLIGRMDSRNGLPGADQYHFNDATVTKEVNYYRVKAISVNGMISFSKVCKVDALDDLPAVMIYPNPVIEKNIQLHFIYPETGVYHVKIINSSGMLFLNEEFTINGSVIKGIDVSGFSSGVYKVIIIDPKGRRISLQAMVK